MDQDYEQCICGGIIHQYSTGEWVCNYCNTEYGYDLVSFDYFPLTNKENP